MLRKAEIASLWERGSRGTSSCNIMVSSLVEQDINWGSEIGIHPRNIKKEEGKLTPLLKRKEKPTGLIEKKKKSWCPDFIETGGDVVYFIQEGK